MRIYGVSKSGRIHREEQPLPKPGKKAAPRRPEPEEKARRKVHGTVYGYDRGCRCDACRAAKVESNRRSKARRLSEMSSDPEDPMHGTETGYWYGCRCARCVQAHSEKRKEKDGNQG